jgi:hypothetical protein
MGKLQQEDLASAYVLRPLTIVCPNLRYKRALSYETEEYLQ